MKQIDAYKLLKKAWEKHKKSPLGKTDSISRIAKITGMPYSNCYNALHGKTNCNADTWVTLMRYFNHLDIHRNEVKRIG